MTTQQDCSIGIAKETTYGTYVVPSRHLEFTSEGFDSEPEFLQGEGLRVGAVLARAARRSTGKVSASGDLEVEALTSGQGILWEAALGQVTVTANGTGGSTHIYTPAVTDPMPSYSIQKGVPLLGGGAIQPHTFLGAMCSSIELTAPDNGILTVKTEWMAKEMNTTTGYAPAVYPAAADLFTFTGGSIYVGNTVTAPSGAALAVVTGSPLANVVDASVKWENNLDDAGYNLGGGGRRTRKNALGLRSGSGKITAEFDSTTLRDAFINQTRLTLVLTFTAGASYGTPGRVSTLQVYCPVIVLEGEIPKANGGDVITQSIDFTILDDGTSNPDIYVTLLTPDAAA